MPHSSPAAPRRGYGPRSPPRAGRAERSASATAWSGASAAPPLRALSPRRSRVFQEVAEAADGAQANPGRLELFAQAVDVELDRVVPHLLVEGEELVEQRLLSHHLPAAQEQQLQKAQLAAGKLERVAVERGPPPDGGERAPPRV